MEKRKRRVKIRIMLDIFNGPIWMSDPDTGFPDTGIEVVDNDELIRKLNYEIGYMYDGYYENDSHDMPVWFNFEQEKKDKEKMLSLLKQLIDRLNELNDGSYFIEDLEIDRIKNL